VNRPLERRLLPTFAHHEQENNAQAPWRPLHQHPVGHGAQGGPPSFLPTGITAQQLVLKMGLGKRDREGVQVALMRMLEQGEVERMPRGRYMATGGRAETDGPEAGSVEATLDLIASGAGYARLGPGLDDVYVPERAVGTALHGDRVLLRLTGGRGRPEGRVLQVLERRRTRYVGKVELQGANWSHCGRTTKR
jgi:exoribonuclease R